MQPGRRNTRVVFRRRAFVSETERGEFEDCLTAWASYTPATGRDQMRAGQEVDLRPATLTISAGPRARDITIAERAVVRGLDHAITSVGLPDPRTGLIEMAITSDIPNS